MPGKGAETNPRLLPFERVKLGVNLTVGEQGEQKQLTGKEGEQKQLTGKELNRNP